MRDIEGEVINILEETFLVQKNTLKSDTMLEMVISDSMDFVELVAVLTIKYKVSIDPQSIRHIRTIRDVAECIKDSPPQTPETLSGF